MMEEVVAVQFAAREAVRAGNAQETCHFSVHEIIRHEGIQR